MRPILAKKMSRWQRVANRNYRHQLGAGAELHFLAQNYGMDYNRIPQGGGSTALTVKYGNQQVVGQLMTALEAVRPPLITFRPTHMDSLYTLIMVDPDAPIAKVVGKEYLHWMVINIPRGDVSRGEVIQPYVGPSPPKKSGVHRYRFYLLQQRMRMQVNTRSYNRVVFDRIAFSEKYNLHEVDMKYFTVDSGQPLVEGRIMRGGGDGCVIV